MAHFPHFLHMTLLSLGFLWLYIAYNSMANLVTSLFDKNGYGPLGNFSLSIIYILWGIGSFISASMLQRLGTRFCMAVSQLSNALWCAVSILTIKPECAM